MVAFFILGVTLRLLLELVCLAYRPVHLDTIPYAWARLLLLLWY